MPYDPLIEKYASYFYLTPEGEQPPSVGDGKTYSRALGWQSPEGNFYEQTRWVRDWHSIVVWDGEDYRLLEMDGYADSINDIPVPRQRHFEIWGIPRPNWPPPGVEYYDARNKDFVFWDAESQSLKAVELYWNIEGEENLPRPGLHVGAAHTITYHDIRVMWNGYYWQRYNHSMLNDDEPWVHVPDGFMDGYTNYQTNTNGAIQFLQSQQLEAAVSELTSEKGKK